MEFVFNTPTVHVEVRGIRFLRTAFIVKFKFREYFCFKKYIRVESYNLYRQIKETCHS